MPQYMLSYAHFGPYGMLRSLASRLFPTGAAWLAHACGAKSVREQNPGETLCGFCPVGDTAPKAGPLRTPIEVPSISDPIAMIQSHVRFLLPALAALVLAGCSSGPDVLDEAEDVLETSSETLEAQTEIRTRPLLVEHDKPYMDRQRVAYAGTPWLHEQVELRAAELPMDIGLKKALEQLPDPPSVVFMPDLTERDVLVTFDHEGTFVEFLNKLAEASGYGWEQKGGALYWSRKITRAFEIHRVPGDFDYSMETVESSEEALEAGGGGGGGGGSTEITGTPESGGSISLAGGGEFWDGVEQALGSFMTEGDIQIDKSRGSVILSGPANMVRRAGEYIGALNKWLSRQVLLEVQLVNVTLTGQRNLGVDWTLVQDAATSTLAANSAGNFAGQLVGSQLSLELSASQSSSIFKGSEVVIRALEDQGQTSVQTSPRIVALNGQAAQLQVLNDRAIVTSRQTTTVADVGTETGVESGLVSTGISLTVMPKIVGEAIYLLANIQVSELIEIRQSSGSAGTQISLPNVQRNQFFQNARLVSGETLALGGLVKREGSDTDSHLPAAELLGTSETKYSNVETVLLITPTLLDPPAADEALLK